MLKHKRSSSLSGLHNPELYATVQNCLGVVTPLLSNGCSLLKVNYAGQIFGVTLEQGSFRKIDLWRNQSSFKMACFVVLVIVQLYRYIMCSPEPYSLLLDFNLASPVNHDSDCNFA